MSLLRLAPLWVTMMVLQISHQGPQTTVSSSDCDFVLSEIKGDCLEPSEEDDHEFIEIQGICPGGNAGHVSLAGKKIALIRAKEKNAYVEGVITLQNYRLNPRGFFVIGGKNVRNRDIEWDSDNVKIKYRIQKRRKVPSVSHFFTTVPVEQVLPHAVVLLHPYGGLKEKSTLGTISMDGNTQGSIRIDAKVEQALRENMIDIVVYGQKTIVDSCDIFSRLSEQLLESGKYVLRGYQIQPPTQSSSSSSPSGLADIRRVPRSVASENPRQTAVVTGLALTSNFVVVMTIDGNSTLHDPCVLWDHIPSEVRIFQSEVYKWCLIKRGVPSWLWGRTKPQSVKTFGKLRLEQVFPGKLNEGDAKEDRQEVFLVNGIQLQPNYDVEVTLHGNITTDNPCTLYYRLPPELAYLSDVVLQWCIARISSTGSTEDVEEFVGEHPPNNLSASVESEETQSFLRKPKLPRKPKATSPPTNSRGTSIPRARPTRKPAPTRPHTSKSPSTAVASPRRWSTTNVPRKGLTTTKLPTASTTTVKPVAKLPTKKSTHPPLSSRRPSQQPVVPLPPVLPIPPVLPVQPVNPPPPPSQGMSPRKPTDRRSQRPSRATTRRPPFFTTKASSRLTTAATRIRTTRPTSMPSRRSSKPKRTTSRRPRTTSTTTTLSTTLLTTRKTVRTTTSTAKPEHNAEDSGETAGETAYSEEAENEDYPIGTDSLEDNGAVDNTDRETEYDNNEEEAEEGKLEESAEVGAQDYETSNEGRVSDEEPQEYEEESMDIDHDSPRAVHIPTKTEKNACINPVISNFYRMSRMMTATGSHPSCTTTSLSRCSITTNGFEPKAWALTPPTPGEPNDCDNKIRFVMEDYATELFRSPSPSPILELPVAEVAQICVPSTRTDIAVNTKITYLDADTPYQGNLLDTELVSAVETKADTVKRLLEARDQAEASLQEGEELAQAVELENKFAALIADMVSDAPDLWPTEWLLGKKALFMPWLEYLPDEDDRRKSTVRCSLCHKHAKALPELNMQHQPDIAKEEGKIRTAKDLNRRMIREHLDSEWHKRIEEMLLQRKEECLMKSLRALQEKSWDELSDHERYTAKMLHIIYTEAKMYLPFRSHEKLIELLEYLDVKIGYHGKHRKAPPALLHFISNDMHEIFLKHLVSKKMPLSLIMDTATDSLAFDHLVVQIQTLEDEKPVVYFYKLIRLGADWSAAGYLRTLKEAFDKDKAKFGIDMYAHLKEHLVGIATDGEATFSGKDNGMAVLLSQELFGSKQRLYRTHCLPHRLNLAGRAVVSAVPELQEFENHIKAMAHFVNPQNALNFAVLTAMAEAEKIELPRITYAFVTRWADSEALVLQRLRTALPQLYRGYSHIASDTTRSGDAPAIAQGLLKVVTDRNYPLFVYFMSDVVEVLASYSKKFQKSGGILIGKEEDRANMISQIEALGSDGGSPHLVELLTYMQCKKDEHSNFNPCGSNAPVKKIDESYQVRLVVPDRPEDTIIFAAANSGRRAPKHFKPIRTTIVEKTVELLNNSFPEKSFADFEPMNPAVMRRDAESCTRRLYGTAEIGNLARRFDLPVAETVRSWQEFSQTMAKRDDFQDVTKVSAQKFWTWALKQVACVGNPLRKLVRIVLAIPATSADAERAFSTLKYIKSSRRTNLKETTLEDLMRVVLNGPDPKYFPAAALAKKYTGRHIGDPTAGGGRKRKAKGVETSPCKRVYGVPAEEADEEAIIEDTPEQDAVEAELAQEIDAEGVFFADEEFEEAMTLDPPRIY